MCFIIKSYVYNKIMIDYYYDGMSSSTNKEVVTIPRIFKIGRRLRRRIINNNKNNTSTIYEYNYPSNSYSSSSIC